MAIRIPCADDEEASLDTVSMHLTSKGYEVVTAKSGKEAIRLRSEDRFDVVLHDIELPGIGGPAVLRYIRTHNIDVHAIMLSGADDLHAFTECARLGAFDYLPKPYNFHELVDLLERVFAEAACISTGETSHDLE